MSDIGGGEGLDFVGKVSIDTSDLVKLINQAKSATTATGSEFDKLGRKFSDAGKQMSLFATVPIAGALAYATNAASDLNEAVNVTDITFGDAKGSIEEFVKTSSKIGQSERAAREATATFGGLLQNLKYTREESAKYAIQLDTLASDLGSAFNKSPQQAVEALGGALRGETEPIRAFNVQLNQTDIANKAVELGLAKSTSSIDTHARAQATLALIMQQTSNYQGDFANTADGVANSQRIVKAEIENAAAEIGKNLLPATREIIGAFRDLVGMFAKLSETQQIALLGLLSFTAALGPTLTLVGNVGKSIDLASAAFKRFGATAILSTAGLTAAFAAIGFMILNDIENAEKFKGTLDGLDSNSLDELTTAFNKLNDQYKKVADSGSYLDGTLQTNSFELAKLNSIAKDVGERYERLVEVYDRVASATGLTRAEVSKLAETQDLDLNASTQDLVLQLLTANSALDKGAANTTAMADAQGVLASKVTTAEEKLKAWKDALDLALGKTLDSQEAELKLAQATSALTESYKEAKGAADLNTEAGQNLRASLYEVERGIAAEIEAFAAEGIIQDTATEKKRIYIEKLEETKKQYPALAGIIQQHIDKLNSIPTEEVTTISVDTTKAKERIAEINKLRADMVDPNKWTVQIGTSGSGTNLVPKYAEGGYVPPRTGTFLVGEEGPELLNIGNFSGSVTNAGDTARALNSGSGGSVSIKVDIHGAIDGASVRGAIPELIDALKAGVGRKRS